jgi:hypothetical protein
MPPMLCRLVTILVLACCIAGCVTREPSPQEITSKRFETVAGKAAVYLFRDRPDISDNAISFTLDGAHSGTTYRGTYYRFELAPGRHRLAGYAADIGNLEFAVEAGRLYFIRHTAIRLRGLDHSVFQMVPAEYGRAAVLRYEMN